MSHNNQNRAQNKQQSSNRGNKRYYRNYNNDRRPNNYQNNIQSVAQNINDVAKDDFDIDDINTKLYPIFGSFAKCNMDFSTFPVLLEKTYNDLCLYEYEESLPFCVFQHWMFEILNNILINGNLDYEDSEYVFHSQIRLPKPIKYYFDQFHAMKSSNKYTIHFNIPDAAKPKEPIEIKNNNGEIIWLPAGSFGPITAETHNLYECYASPLISKRLIERTIYANESNDFEPWNPLPFGAYPVDSVCTENLIGYRLPEKLSEKALDVLKRIKFYDENENKNENDNEEIILKKILCHSEEVFKIMRKIWCKEQYMTYMKLKHFSNFKFDSHNHEGILGFVESEISDKETPDFTKNITKGENIKIYSPEVLNNSECLKSIITGLRRRRNNKMPGYCMIKSDGSAIEGWEETMNDNFEMNGIFDYEMKTISVIQRETNLQGKEFLQTKYIRYSFNSRDVMTNWMRNIFSGI